MEQITEFIMQYGATAPWVIFGLLLLAGFNIPVSEDGMIFVSAIMAAQLPDIWWHFFLAVYLGAFFSDIICFSLGRYLGPQMLKIKWFAGMMSPERMKKIQGFYEKYGIFTLVFGRFIPFGVRNALFLTAGFGKMNFAKFLFSDGIACTISTTAFFYLYYHFGKAVMDDIALFGQIVAGVAVVAVIVIIISKRKKPASP